MTERNISPFGVVLYCHLCEDCRIFRLDRVRDVVDSGECYEAADINPNAYVLESLTYIMPGLYVFKVIVHTPVEAVFEINDYTQKPGQHNTDAVLLR